jgi:hypothetical protein
LFSVREKSRERRSLIGREWEQEWDLALCVIAIAIASYSELC